MAKIPSRVAVLRRKGFAIKYPLPQAYEEVIESLSDAEIEVLVKLKERLDKAELATPPEVGPYREYFVPL